MRNYPRLAVARLALLLVLALLSPAFVWADVSDQAPEDRPAKAPAGWRVIWTADPATEATISWNTREAGEKHVLYYDTESHDGDLSAYAHNIECQRDGQYTVTSSKLGELHFHHARLSDLKPATTYYFVIQSDEHVSPELHFRTGPNEDEPFALLFGGDSRSDREARRQVNRMIGELTDEHDRLLAFVHGGDYIVTGTNLDQWYAWMNDHELIAGDDGRILPIVPARGNHDRGPIYDQVFDFPEGDGNYFAFSIGPECRLLTLNTEISAAGDQKIWLEKELASARRKHRWVVAQYHRPAWPAVKGPSSARQHWVPLFEKYDLDLACEADGHNIKRTPPIRDEQIDSTGITYIGEGGLGVPQRTPKIADRWWLQSPGKAGKGHHVHLLQFNQNQLRVRVLLLEGDVFDEHTLQPRR